MKNAARYYYIVLYSVIFAVVAIGLLTLPAMPYPGDPAAWHEEARSLIARGTLSIPPDIATESDRGHLYTYNEATGKWYSKYGSLNGLLSTIPSLAMKAITGALPPDDSPTSILFLGIFFVFIAVAIACTLFAITGFYTENPWVQGAYVLMAFYTTYLWNYLRSTTSESTQLLFFALFYLFFLRFIRWQKPLSTRPSGSMYASWLVLLLLCLCKVSYLAFLPLYALLLACLIIKESISTGARVKLLCRMILLPAALLLSVQGAVHYIKFGSPLLSGYHQWDDPENPHGIFTAIADLLFSGQGSIFVHFPLLFLAAFSARKFFGAHRAEALLLLGCLVITFAVVAPQQSWRGEWAYGPRYFVSLLPLIALPALYSLQWLFTSRTALQLPLLTSVFVACVLLANAQMDINRLDFFFKYRIEIRPEKAGNTPPSVRAYFTQTNFAVINADHLRHAKDGSWEKLPYYAELKQHAQLAQLEAWKKFVEWETSRSNLYWFP